MDFRLDRSLLSPEKTRFKRYLLERHKDRRIHLEALLQEMGGWKRDLLSFHGWRILAIDEDPTRSRLDPKVMNYWGLHHTFNRKLLEILDDAGLNPLLTGSKGNYQILIKPYNPPMDTYTVLYAACSPFYEAIVSLQRGIIWTTSEPKTPQRLTKKMTR